jgi:predicted nucleic acid-binding Zn ribbon protein
VSKGTKYSCPECGQEVTIFVKVNHPPMHQCGGSSRPEKYLPMDEVGKKASE